jgi:lysophospholipase L1-like esterase
MEKLPDIPFVNEVRLNARQWLCAIALLIALVLGIPRAWKHLEHFETGRDYRIPYALSKDYWLYERRLEGLSKTNILLLGDSVVWGEYVLEEGALSHFLNEQSQAPGRFINAGVNGLYPLAIEGLVNHYAPVRGQKIILHCNVLWMSSPKADLQETKAQQINHARLLPQFTPRIPSYRADANERLSAAIERNVQFQSWVTHLQTAYFADKSIPAWTLIQDESDPPQYPNAYKNPLSQIAMRVPSAPATDPERGPASPRHKPWTQTGATPTSFDWVAAETSLQWAAFKRTLATLRARGNDVLVVIGPFNEHIIAPESQPAFRTLRDAIAAHLAAEKIPFAQPEALPSALYADGSHPLTEGYQLLAERLYADDAFQGWLHK